MDKIKYEPVFGNQSLFDESCNICNSIAVRVDVDGCSKTYFHTNLIEAFNFVIDISQKRMVFRSVAMRRIIKQPQWTWEDKKAGRLPEVGSVIEFYYDSSFCIPSHLRDWKSGDAVEVIAITSIKDAVIILVKNKEERMHQIQSIALDCLRPIETQEEVNRLREEFVSSCMKNKDQLLSREFRLGLECAYDEMQRRNKESS